MKSLIGVGEWVLMLLLVSGMALGEGVKSSELKTSAGKVDITPTRSAYLSGYGINRKASETHDPLMARCLILESGETRMAIVSCDLLGVPRFQSEKIRALVKSVAPEYMIIGATHTHSGPDIVGMWGPDIQTSGVDQEWMVTFRLKVAQLVEDTVKHLQPAAIRFAHTTDVPKISKNIRIPRVLDTELGVMQVVEKESEKPIATLVNYACHPEILNNRKITADFPHWLYETVEGKAGGVCLYLNGAQGGMITADFDETSAPKGENWQAAQSIGTSLGQRVLEIVEKAETVRDVPITIQRRIYNVPLENPRYKTLITLGIFPKDLLKNGSIETEIYHLTIGPAELVTIPGEALPNIGFYLKRLMHGQPKFLFGLTGDFLGYILTPEDFGLELYGYETSQSVGSQMEPLLVQHLKAMLSEDLSGKKRQP